MMGIMKLAICGDDFPRGEAPVAAAIAVLIRAMRGDEKRREESDTRTVCMSWIHSRQCPHHLSSSSMSSGQRR
jgi:hypothetical protein